MPAPDPVYAPIAPREKLANDPEADVHASTIHREGFVVLRNVLSSAEVAAMRAALDPYLQGLLMGRNDFEGFHTERVYALLAKNSAFSLLVEHPRLLAIVDRLLAPHYLLSAFLAINVHPGETPQGWHFDDGGCRAPRPRPMHGVSAIWALDEFTTENGATELIPRSHLWKDDGVPNSAQAVPICMSAGSVVVLAGTLWHRGGASRGALSVWVSHRSTASRGCASLRTWPSPCHRPWLAGFPLVCRSYSATASLSPASWGT